MFSSICVKTVHFCLSERRGSQFSTSEHRQLNPLVTSYMILFGCFHSWLKKRKRNKKKTAVKIKVFCQNGRACDPHKSCLGAKLTEQREETVHSIELGVVYSKIESSKANRQEKSEQRFIKSKTDASEEPRAQRGPTQSHYTIRLHEMNHFKSQLYKRDTNQITATTDNCCTVQ